MSEAGSENNDSPFECLTDQDTNGGSGHSHTSRQSTVSDVSVSSQQQQQQQQQQPPPPPTGASAATTGATASIDMPPQESIINQLTPTSPLLTSASWVNGLLSRVAVKAKDSVDSVITTLDPGMREIIYSGGEVNIAAIIDTDENGRQLIAAIRDGFIDVFGRVTMKGIQVTASDACATVIGHEAAEAICRTRISSIRRNMSENFPQNQVVVTMQSFIHKLSNTSYALTAVYLHDPLDDSHFVTHTQSTPIPVEAINWLECEKTTSPPKTLQDWYKLQHFAVPSETEAPASFEESATSITRESMLRSASIALAKWYKLKLQSR